MARLNSMCAVCSLVFCTCRVYRQQQRPHFPPGTWTNYQSLAERCWAAEPADRPSFDEIIPQLQQLLHDAGGPFTCASPFTPE